MWLPVYKLILYAVALFSLANVLIAAVMVILICCLAPQWHNWVHGGEVVARPGSLFSSLQWSECQAALAAPLSSVTGGAPVWTSLEIWGINESSPHRSTSRNRGVGDLWSREAARLLLNSAVMLSGEVLPRGQRRCNNGAFVGAPRSSYLPWNQYK